MNYLAGDLSRGVYAIGNSIYVATDDGLRISTNGGVSWSAYTTANGLATNAVFGVYAVPGAVYAATLDFNTPANGGLSISYPLLFA
jgi:hypothetical protein